MELLKKVVSIICEGLGFIFGLFGFLIGLQSIEKDGWEQLGSIFIMPSIIALIIIILDFLVTIGKIKKGLIYSVISSLIKVGSILILIPSFIYDYKYEMQYGVSDLKFYFILIIMLIVIAMPSILNTIKLIALRKKSDIAWLFNDIIQF